MKRLEKKQLVVVAFTFALLLLIGGTYAYFSINASNDKTGAKVTGKANNLGNPTMQTKTSKLYLNLDANLMSQANAGKTYYANENESGLALETNPNYVLASVNLPDGDESLDCTYYYQVTATVTTPITDNSDSNVIITVGDKKMTLKELVAAGSDGIIVSGNIKNLTKGQSVTIPLTSSVTNSASVQDNLVGNSYTIKIQPYYYYRKTINDYNGKAFHCHTSGPILTQHLINLGDSYLWQSGLEGDGYRHRDQGKNRDKYIVNNYTCFGTTNVSECIENKDKYMYRILGVFPDANGDNHVKLVKYIPLEETYAWNSGSDATWENSSLYKGLNRDYFLTNTAYDYLQNNLWNNKIENWTWSAVKTQNVSGGYPIYYNTLTPSQIYLHEMNRSTKTNTTGSWTTPTGKIGLMYISDLLFALGNDIILESTKGLYDENYGLGWLDLDQIEDYNAYDQEWTISSSEGNVAWGFRSDRLYPIPTSYDLVVRPVFYLNSDIKLYGGDGSKYSPYILQ